MWSMLRSCAATIEWRPSTILPILLMLFVFTAQLTSLRVNVTITTYPSVRSAKRSLKFPRNQRNNVCVQHTCMYVYCKCASSVLQQLCLTHTCCTAVCGLYVTHVLHFVACTSCTTSIINNNNKPPARMLLHTTDRTGNYYAICSGLRGSLFMRVSLKLVLLR